MQVTFILSLIIGIVLRVCSLLRVGIPHFLSKWRIECKVSDYFTLALLSFWAGLLHVFACFCVFLRVVYLL